MTPDNVDAYITEIKQRVGSVTLYGSIYKLRRVSQLIAPDRDFAWLSEIEKDLALTMRPRSKFDRLVLTEVLVEAGLSLIAEAETTTSLTKLQRARQVRNGLMVALLAFCPIRLRTSPLWRSAGRSSRSRARGGSCSLRQRPRRTARMSDPSTRC